MRNAAARALGKLGDQRAVEPLIAALGHEDAGLRWDATVALGELGDPRALEPLIVALGDNDNVLGYLIRTDAAKALGKLGDPRAVEPLKAALCDRYDTVRQAAAEALDDLKWEPGQDQIAAYYWATKREWDKCVAIGAPAVKALAAILNDDTAGYDEFEREDIHQAAEEAMYKIGIAPTTVQYDASGRVLSVEALQGRWALRQEGEKWYCSQKASSLLQATEILKRLDSIPPLTYYIIDTPDGSLGRDVQGFYTVGPLRTEDLVVGSRVSKVEAVECVSLRGFGDEIASQQTVAFLKSRGEYARLVLLMECGHCGYQSPVETEEGEFLRECYCCGAKNKCYRMGIKVFMGTELVSI